MDNRYVIKIVGASGQGINVLGEILSKAFMRSNYGVFAYREYPSLIKGGHATYQIDISSSEIQSPSQEIDILMVLNKQATKWHLDEMKHNGIIFHDIDNPRINKTEADLMVKKNIKLIYVPALRLSLETGGNDITANIVSLGSIWKLTDLPIDVLKVVVRDKFQSKPKIVELDVLCVQKGYDFTIDELPNYKKRIMKEDEISEDEKSLFHIKNIDEITSERKFTLNKLHKKIEYIQITGNEALSLGTINCGVRIYYAYPMTPVTSILEFLGEHAHLTGMILKQAEDEITASSMAIGSMFMGTRALTATSGGGFDLMTEHLSFTGITEIPFVCVIGQRPGPATGMPTWTTQGDLRLALFSGHGEFSRCVIAVKDAEDAFYSIQEAFNIAEEYQMPVLVLTDKYVAESLYQTNLFDTNKIAINRGELITDPIKLKELKSSDRFKISETGISKRWLPGSEAADFNVNSDEHDEEGNTTEEGDIAAQMIAKRLKKQETLKNNLGDPEIFTNNVKEKQAKKVVNVIGWGSTYSVVHDVIDEFEKENIKINYLHIKYLWPLRTEVIEQFIKNNPETLLIECNHQGQLGEVIRMQTGIEIKNKLLKWNGRPFFVDEVISYIRSF